MYIAYGTSNAQERHRAQELGVHIGILKPEKYNTITDVPGVTVGHTTLFKRDNIRTGITAIVPHSCNLFQEKVPGAVFVGNGFEKLLVSHR